MEQVLSIAAAARRERRRRGRGRCRLYPRCRHRAASLSRNSDIEAAKMACPACLGRGKLRSYGVGEPPRLLGLG